MSLIDPNNKFKIIKEHSGKVLITYPICILQGGYFKVKAKYIKLEEQNENFLKKFLGNNDIPEGCAACDNPTYPDCQYSCPMFDD